MASQSFFIQNPGAQGRIRTSVARYERQIYSLLPLTTRPPVHVLPSTTARRNRQTLAIKEPSKRPQIFRQNSASGARCCLRAKFVLGSCCWVQFSRRALRPAWLASVATPRGALRVMNLELAKGFEPPTL